jgi:peptide methionine sulfoxide reductase MsrB
MVGQVSDLPFRRLHLDAVQGDNSHGMQRDEGRYCMNSASLNFYPCGKQQSKS